jgi:hypothetical protein
LRQEFGRPTASITPAARAARAGFWSSVAEGIAADSAQATHQDVCYHPRLNDGRHAVQ